MSEILQIVGRRHGLEELIPKKVIITDMANKSDILEMYYRIENQESPKSFEHVLTMLVAGERDLTLLVYPFAAFLVRIDEENRARGCPLRYHIVSSSCRWTSVMCGQTI